MGLVKCKECGEKISSKSKACPKCGVPRKKKMGCLSFIFLCLFIFFIFGVILSYEPNRYNNSGITIRDTEKANEALIKPQKHPSVLLIARIIEESTSDKKRIFKINTEKLYHVDNPKGAGYFIAYPEISVSGFNRQFVWFVLNGHAYNLNSPAYQLTPQLKWPREHPKEQFQDIGIDVFSLTRFAVELCYR